MKIQKLKDGRLRDAETGKIVDADVNGLKKNIQYLKGVRKRFDLAIRNLEEASSYPENKDSVNNAVIKLIRVDGELKEIIGAIRKL